MFNLLNLFVFNYIMNRNKLLRQFQNRRSNMYQNNNFLNRNTVINNSNNSKQHYLMELEKQKEHQRIRQLEKYNIMLENLDKNELKQMVLDHAFQKEKNKEDQLKRNMGKKNIEQLYKAKINKHIPTRETYWKERTNEPYKVISGKKYFKKFYKKDTTNATDLIIHKIVPAINNEAEKKFIACKNKRDEDNKELSILYSDKKKAEHEKKFQYIHIFKQRSYNPSTSHTDMKKYKTKQYKKEKSNI